MDIRSASNSVNKLPVLSNIEIYTEDGELIYKNHNTVCEKFREGIVDYLLGSAPATPQYIAVGVGSPTSTENPATFTVLKEELKRNIQSSRVEQAPDVARISAVFNTSTGQAPALSELGLFDAAESTQRIANCDATSGGNEGTWTTDGTNTLTLSTTRQEGSGSIQTVGTGSLSFLNSTLTVGASVTASETNDQVNLWYYINPSLLPASGFLQIRIGSDASNYYQWRLAASAFASGANWNHLELAFAASGGTAVSNGATARNAIANSPDINALDYVRIESVDSGGSAAVKTGSSTERLDFVRVWRTSQGNLWAYSEVSPTINTSNRGYVVYWYLSTREGANPKILEPFADEALVISTTAVVLTAATYAPTNGAPATRALVTVGSTSIRYWTGGATPTSTTGHLGQAADVFYLDSYTEITQFRAIEVSGASSIFVTYYR